jgi:outer membrane immunogenic protein
MRRLSLALLATAAFSQFAVAADLPARAAAPAYKAAPMIAPVFTWSGFYIGGNVGGLWATKDWNLNPGGAPISSQSPSGFLGGVQAGVNFQAASWVFGIQGDYDWSSASGSAADLVAIGDTDRTRIRGLGSVTGRVGYALDRALLYVKGGGAWVRDDYDVFVTATGAPAASASETRGGWTVGGGVEFAFAPNWSAFAEYDYYGFGTRANTFTAAGGGTFGTADIRQKVSVVKGGINYRFDWGH